MKLLVDIPEEHLNVLQRLSDDRGFRRDELIRDIVSSYLAERSRELPESGDKTSLDEKKQARDSALDRAFGLWADHKEDGLAYQERLRREWDREWDK